MSAESLLPDGSQPARAGVPVIHSRWGRTASFTRFGAALAARGLACAVADLFQGETAETETQARALRAAPRRRPMYRELEADLATLRAALGNPAAPVGVVGFSMGGHWAVWLCQRPEYALSSCVLYYAARAGDWSRAASPVLAHFAEADPFVSPAARRGMERAIARAGLAYESCDYPGTGHWFAEPARPAAFHPQAAETAFARTLAHLDATLA